MASRYFFAWRMFARARARDERNNMASVRARTRISTNPQFDITDTEFRRRYRLPKKVFEFLCKELKTLTDLKPSQRVTLETKVGDQNHMRYIVIL